MGKLFAPELKEELDNGAKKGQRRPPSEHQRRQLAHNAGQQPELIELQPKHRSARSG
jgi:hypothetical protein